MKPSSFFIVAAALLPGTSAALLSGASVKTFDAGAVYKFFEKVATEVTLRGDRKPEDFWEGAQQYLEEDISGWAPAEELAFRKYVIDFQKANPGKKKEAVRVYDCVSELQMLLGEEKWNSLAEERHSDPDLGEFLKSVHWKTGEGVLALAGASMHLVGNAQAEQKFIEMANMMSDSLSTIRHDAGQVAEENEEEHAGELIDHGTDPADDDELEDL